MNKHAINSKALTWSAALVVAGVVAGCGGGNSGSTDLTQINFQNSAAGAGAVTLGATCSGASCVSLGTAGNYAILAKTGVSTVPGSVVTGHIGLSPAARPFLTGWSLISEPTDTFFTSSQVAAPGKLYAADNVGGTTSSDLTTAVGNMQTAYTEAAGKPAGVGPNLNIGGGTVPAQTLAPGTYTWTSAVTITGDLTFNGSATDVWILQVAGTLNLANTKKIILAGGASAKNIFWQVSGAVTAGTTAHFEGIILGQTGITFNTGSSINGRLLAQSAVVLDMTTVSVPQ